MISHSAAETKKIGNEFVLRLQRGDVVALVGHLGAGKTTFVQGMAAGLGVAVKTYVRSPTFTLINEYPGKIPLYHFDLYRLERREELAGLGIDEYFDGDGITVVEWGDKFPDLLPAKTLTARFAMIDEQTREIELPC